LWYIAKFIQSLGDALPSGLRDGVDNWALSFRIGILFYLFLVTGTSIMVNFSGINPEMRLTMRLALIKDYSLIFIISGMLYVGLFKLARARSLEEIFGKHTGFIQFVIVCGIIAVLAVWADYRQLDPLRLESIFPTAWQRQYMEAHVPIRDILLLLLPISSLLFWTVKCIAEERQHN
jgi:hypothetical protein